MIGAVSRVVCVIALLTLACPPAMARAEVSGADISAQPAVARLVSMHVVDMRRAPAVHASPAMLGFSRPREMPLLSAVSPTTYAELKKLAAYNPAAPFDPYPMNESAFARYLRLTPSPSVAFNGMSDSGATCPPSGCAPPDMALAASTKFVLQGVNTSFAVFDTTGSLQPGWPKTANSFFGVPSPGSCANNGPAAYVYDPRAFFDTVHQRFWAAILEAEGVLSPPINFRCPFGSRMWIAVSQTSNPNGVWYVYAYDMTLGKSYAADFTQIGLDSRAFYFSGNMYSRVKGNFIYSELLSAAKTSLENGMMAPAYGFVNLPFTVHPALELSSSPPSPSPVEFAVNSALCATSSCSGIETWAIAKGGTPHISISGVTVASLAYTMAPKASQPSCSQCIETGDTRISGTPIFRKDPSSGNDLISFALETGVNNGTAVVPGILWGQIQPALNGPTIVGGKIYQANYYAFSGNNAASFGALMPDKDNNLFMVFDNMGPTIYPSALYVARKATDPLGTFEPFVVLKAGEASTSDSRWGDYEAASYDGVLTNNVWLASQYSPANNDWSTFIGKTHF